MSDDGIAAARCQGPLLGIWCGLSLIAHMRDAGLQILAEHVLAADGSPGFAPQKTLGVPGEREVIYLADALELALKSDGAAEKVACQRAKGGPCPHGRALVELPHWDSVLRVLRFRGKIVKQFKEPAPDQETIFMVFEESNWAERIDDPLPPRGDVAPKERLHHTIWRLNRNQRNKLLVFSGDGTGEGIRWAPVAGTDGATS